MNEMGVGSRCTRDLTYSEGGNEATLRRGLSNQASAPNVELQAQK